MIANIAITIGIAWLMYCTFEWYEEHSAMKHERREHERQRRNAETPEEARRASMAAAMRRLDAEDRDAQSRLR